MHTTAKGGERTKKVMPQEGGPKVTVWTSTLVRAISTSQYIPKRKLHLRVLDEIDAGTCTGLTYNEIGMLEEEKGGALIFSLPYS